MVIRQVGDLLVFIGLKKVDFVQACVDEGA